jgi:parallel beta-helix repeat protein
MNTTRIFVIGILQCICLSALFFSPANGEEITAHTVYAGGNGPGNYSSIQDALENVTAGDIVFVYQGTYHEHLVVTTPAHLMGENKNTTIIDGDFTGYVVTLNAGNSTLSGFTIIHSEMIFPFAGVYVTSDYNTILDTILTDNFYGMQLGYGATHNTVFNNTVRHNGRCGIYFNHASQNYLSGNTISDHPVNGFGLYEFSNNNSITHNSFFGNRDTGVNIRESYDTLVVNNTFSQNKLGLHSPAPEYHTIERDNIFSDNGLALNEERDAFVFTVVVFAVLVSFVFLVFRKFLSS